MLAPVVKIAGLLGINVPRLIAYAVVAAMVVVGYFVVRQHFINIGRAQVVNEIAAGNQERQEDVKAAISKVDDCRRRGGVFDTTSGLCG